MLIDFAGILVFFLFGILFVVLNMGISKLLSPKVEDAVKAIPYECGEKPVGTTWIRFNPRYYFYALAFLIFDVEIAFMYPCAVAYKSWISRGQGSSAFLEVALFVLILIAGFAYMWRRGDLNWIKTIELSEEVS
ncbi:MAG: NADH-quinone oxidoreductase subunit A [Bdellovibrionales bacterium]|nr:NADH-quinone oxidoreductase subunit A [Bdellovibrionales bacterium]